MKSRIFCILVGCLLLMAVYVPKTHAAPLQTSPSQKPPAQKSGNKTPANVESLLAEAYADLDRADHDYKGNRIKAMKQIEAAGKLLHLNLGGDGHGHEKQGVSDEQLRAAEGVLNQIKAELTDKKHKALLHHVNKALEHLALALKIK